MDPCNPADQQPFDPTGIWEYEPGCSYVDTSPNLSSQLGLGCSGRLAICGDASSGSLSWQDVGPNGIGIGTPTDMTLRSDQGQYGGFMFAVYGRTQNRSPGSSCAADVEHYLLCARGEHASLGTFEAFCTKASYKVDGACGVDSGYVRSEFYFQRIADCP